MTSAPGHRIARLAVLALAVAGCYGSGGSASGPPAAESTWPSGSPAATLAPGASAAIATPDASSIATPPTDAARRLLSTAAAAFDMTVVREKRPQDPIETLIAGSGRVEPPNGRGQARYDLTGLVAPPGTPAPSIAALVAEVVWTPDELVVQLASEPGGWQARPRDEARRSGGLVGRLPDEVIGLVRLVADASPGDAVVALDPVDLDGAPAERWLVRSTLEAAAAAGVPADVPDAATVREQYGVTTVDVEVWLVAGELRRLRYAFTREEAPYGGPDRTTVTYDWRESTPDVPIAIPTGS